MNTLLDTYLLELTNECQCVSQKLNAIGKREGSSQQGMPNTTTTPAGATAAAYDNNKNDLHVKSNNLTTTVVDSIVSLIDELQGAAERCDGTLNSCFAALHNEITSLQQESRRFEEHYPDLTSCIINSTAALSPVYNSALLPAQSPSLQATPSLRYNSPRLAELRSPVLLSTSLPSPSTMMPISASLPVALSQHNAIARTAIVTTPTKNSYTNVQINTNVSSVTNLASEEKLQSPMAFLSRTPAAAAARRTSQSLSISVSNNNTANSARNALNTLLTSPNVNRPEDTPMTNSNIMNRGSEERHNLLSSSQLHHSILSPHATLPPLELSMTRGQPIADVCSPCSEQVKKFLRSHINWGAIRDDEVYSMKRMKYNRQWHHRHNRHSYSNAHDENEINNYMYNEKRENRHEETLPPYGVYQPTTPSPPRTTANTANINNYYYSGTNNISNNVNANPYRENVIPLSATEGVSRGWTFGSWRHRSLFQPRVRERSTTERSSSEEYEAHRDSGNESIARNRRNNENGEDQRMSGRVLSEKGNNKTSRSRSTQETNVNKMTNNSNCKTIAPTTVEEEMVLHSRKLYRPSLRSTFDTLILQQLCYDGIALSQEMREELGYNCNNNNCNSHEWNDSSSESSTCSSLPSLPEIPRTVYAQCNSRDSLPMTEKEAELLYVEHENAIACEVRTNVFTLPELQYTWQEYNEIHQWWMSAEQRPKKYSHVKTIVHDSFPVTVEWLENTLLNVSFKLYQISEKVNKMRTQMRFRDKKEEEQQGQHGQAKQENSKTAAQGNLAHNTRKQQQQQQEDKVNELATISIGLTTAIPVTSSVLVSATNTENNSQTTNPVAREQNNNNSNSNNANLFTPPTPPTYEYNDGDLYELIREVETTLETYERTQGNNNNNNNNNNYYIVQDAQQTTQEEDEQESERLHSHSTEHHSHQYSTSVDAHDDEAYQQELEEEEENMEQLEEEQHSSEEEEEEEELESDEEEEEESEQSTLEVEHDLLNNESDVEQHEWEYGSAYHDEIIAPVNENDDEDEDNHGENISNEDTLETGEHLITTTTNTNANDNDNDNNEEEHQYSSHGNANENVSEYSSAAEEHWHTPHETSFDVNTLQVSMEHNTELEDNNARPTNHSNKSPAHESQNACKTTSTKESIEQKNIYNITKYNTNKYIALLRHIQRRAQLLLSDLAVFCVLQHLSRIVHDTTIITNSITNTNGNEERNAPTHNLQTQVLQNVLIFIQSIQSDIWIRERVQMELETRNKLYEEECKVNSHVNIKVVYEDESYANSASISKSAKGKNAQAAAERNTESANSYLLSYQHIFTFVSYISLLFTQLNTLSHGNNNNNNNDDDDEDDDENKTNGNVVNDTSGKERMLQKVAQFVHSVTPFLSLWQTHSEHNDNNSNNINNTSNGDGSEMNCKYESENNNLLNDNIRELSRVRTTPHRTSAPFGLEQSSLPHSLAPIVWQENVCASLLSEVHKIFQLEKEVLPRVQPDNRKSVEMHELMETWANRVIAESCNNEERNKISNNSNSDKYNAYVEVMHKVNSADNALARYIYPLSLPLLSELDVFYGRGLLPEIDLDEKDDFDTIDHEALTKALNESSSDDDSDENDSEEYNRINEAQIQNSSIINEMQNFTLPPSSLPAHASRGHVRRANTMSSTENITNAQEGRGNNTSVPTFFSTLQVTPSSAQTLTTTSSSRRVQQQQQQQSTQANNNDDFQEEEHGRVSVYSHEQEQSSSSIYHQRTPEHVPVAHHPRREWAESSQHTSTSATYAGSDVTSTTTTMNTSTNTIPSSSPYVQVAESRTFTTSAFHAPMPPPPPPPPPFTATTNSSTTTTTTVNPRNTESRTINTELQRGNNRPQNDEKDTKIKHKEDAHAMTMELPHAIAILEARERRHKHSTRSSPSEYLQFVSSALYPWSGDITLRVSAFMKDYIFSRGLCVVANAQGNLALAWKPVFRTTMCYCPVTRRRCLDPLVSGALVKTNEQLLLSSETTTSSNTTKSIHHGRSAATSEMNRMRTNITNVNTAIVEGFGQRIAEARGLTFRGVDPSTGIIVLSLPDTSQAVTFINTNDDNNNINNNNRTTSSNSESVLRQAPELLNLFLHWPSEEVPANLPVQVGTIFPMAIASSSTNNNSSNRNTTVTPFTPVQANSSQEQEYEEEEEPQVQVESTTSTTTRNTPSVTTTTNAAATTNTTSASTQTSESNEQSNQSPTLISLLSAGVSRESPHHHHHHHSATQTQSHGTFSSEWEDTTRTSNTTNTVQTHNEQEPPPPPPRQEHEERRASLEQQEEHVSNEAQRNTSSSTASLQTRYILPSLIHGARRSTNTTETLHATEIASPVNRASATGTTRTTVPMTRSSTSTNIPRRTTSATNVGSGHRRSSALSSTATTPTTTSTPTHHRNTSRATNVNSNNAPIPTTDITTTTTTTSNNNNSTSTTKGNEFTNTSREMLTRNLYSNPITERAQRLNPPDLLQCGHVISHKVLQGMCVNIRQLTGETVVYCPYCRRGTTLKSVMTLSYIYEASQVSE